MINKLIQQEINVVSGGVLGFITIVKASLTFSASAFTTWYGGACANKPSMTETTKCYVANTLPFVAVTVINDALPAQAVQNPPLKKE